ncbi:MAG TPA: hypothetical protein VG457_08250, partial [Planctomycetota bacterium]|nr:hypothetical protein [Planctomycetota bacterium]
EFRTSGSAAAGHVQVNVGGTAALTAAAFLAAVNANPPAIGITASLDPVTNTVIRLTANKPGVAGNVGLVITEAASATLASGATLVGGYNAGTQTEHHGSYVVTANDVTATNVEIDTNLTSPVDVVVRYFQSTGEEHLSITDRLTVSGAKIEIAQHGATHLAAGDIVRWIAWAA